jgi:16S rRNA (guanine527-N7)-methyltransferase
MLPRQRTRAPQTERSETDLATPLAHGLAQLGLDLAPAVQARLLAYLALLRKWNRVYNLTAVREAQRMVSQHLLDSLAVAPHVTAPALLDVGSGAGLPGLPLALALPSTHVTLLEPNHKKAAFLHQAKLELGLHNVTVVRARVEDWRPGRTFERVISRAVFDLADFVSLAGRHAGSSGLLAAMKGLYPHEEIARLPAGWRLHRALPLAVPGLRAQRHLILLARS